MRIQKLKHGGIKLPYTTINTDKRIIQTLPIPSLVRIPLKGETNEVGVPLVKVGDFVVEGQEIAHIGDLYFHSSVSGKVSKIEEMPFVDYHFSGNITYIEIIFQGKLINWKQEESQYQNDGRDELIKTLFRKGVINLTPRPYLTLKEILKQSDVKHIIINGLDSGPYLSYLEHLIIEKLDHFFSAALNILNKLFNPKKMTLAIFDHLQDKAEQIRKHPIHTVFVENIYPQSLEPLLVKTVLKKTILDEAELIKEKVIIIDLATLYAMYQAIVFGKPLIDRVLTIDGQLVENPGNYLVRVGTLIETVLEDCSVFDKPEKILSGNPLNGLTLKDLSLPCHKRTEGLLVATTGELVKKEPNACISCGLCEIHCPVELIPSQVLFLNNAEELSKTCILCGVCDFVCPSSIPLFDLFEEHKKRN